MPAASMYTSMEVELWSVFCRLCRMLSLATCHVQHLAACIAAAAAVFVVSAEHWATSNAGCTLHSLNLRCRWSAPQLSSCTWHGSGACTIHLSSFVYQLKLESCEFGVADRPAQPTACAGCAHLRHAATKRRKQLRRLVVACFSHQIRQVQHSCAASQQSTCTLKRCCSRTRTPQVTWAPQRLLARKCCPVQPHAIVSRGTVPCSNSCIMLETRSLTHFLLLLAPRATVQDH